LLNSTKLAVTILDLNKFNFFLIDSKIILDVDRPKGVPIKTTNFENNFMHQDLEPQNRTQSCDEISAYHIISKKKFSLFRYFETFISKIENTSLRKRELSLRERHNLVICKENTKFLFINDLHMYINLSTPTVTTKQNMTKSLYADFQSV